MSGQVNLAFCCGSLPRPANALVAELLAGGPAFTWCEPTPTRQGLQRYPGLWRRQEITGPTPDVPLDEARLFWPGGGVHVVGMEGARARWAAFWESDSPGAPPWLAPLEDVRPEVVEVSRSAVGIFTRRDFARYGLAGVAPELPDRLRVIEYRWQTELLFWGLGEEQ